MITGLTLTDLSNFTGQPTTYFEWFVSEALAQAGDLFELATELTDLPSDGLDERIAKRGVLAMAEALYEGNKNRDIKFSPFRSETIGSYTYSLASEAIRRGVPTGISWFDIAVDRFGPSQVHSSGISVFDRPGDVGELDGVQVLWGPADRDDWHGSPVVFPDYDGRI